MDRAGLVEQQIILPRWKRDGLKENINQQYLNWLGTNDAFRLPMRSAMGPQFFFSQCPRIQETRRQLNVRHGRYHAPGGLENDARDVYGINNSDMKIEKSQWNFPVIETNSGDSHNIF
jgi:hypothetical protein